MLRTFFWCADRNVDANGGLGKSVLKLLLQLRRMSLEKFSHERIVGRNKKSGLVGLQFGHVLFHSVEHGRVVGKKIVSQLAPSDDDVSLIEGLRRLWGLGRCLGRNSRSLFRWFSLNGLSLRGWFLPSGMNGETL